MEAYPKIVVTSHDRRVRVPHSLDGHTCPIGRFEEKPERRGAREEVRSRKSNGPLDNDTEVLSKRKKNQGGLGSSINPGEGQREEPGPAKLGPRYRCRDGIPGQQRQGHQGTKSGQKGGRYRAREAWQHGQPDWVGPQPGFRPPPHQGSPQWVLMQVLTSTIHFCLRVLKDN